MSDLGAPYVNVATGGYGDSQGKWVNTDEITAIVPNAFDERKTTIILRSGKEIISQMRVDEVTRLIAKAGTV